nr:MAG TPA: hypothetical protein [Caudoviricetes sp.]
MENLNKNLLFYKIYNSFTNCSLLNYFFMRKKR